MAIRKKLIEVALPLEKINEASVNEKSIRHGHPSTLHLWWARRPLATARAVLFASLVDDPGNEISSADEAQKERRRLHKLMANLADWKKMQKEELLQEARYEIAKSIARNKGLLLPEDASAKEVQAFLRREAPSFYDPFAGGGSLPLEAQRLGLPAQASDLNPVAVLLNKAQIEIPPRFAGRAPVNPEEPALLVHHWSGAAGLANDLRYYGQWLRERVLEHLAPLFPSVKVTRQKGERHEAPVIAWLWARTAPCPNPACGLDMPLVRTFWLSKKKGRETWVEPIIEEIDGKKRVRFVVHREKGNVTNGTVNRRGAICLGCGQPVPLAEIRRAGQEGRMGEQLMAIVAEGKQGRLYLDPDPEHERIARQAQPHWQPAYKLPRNLRNFNTPNYGMKFLSDLFTPRQLLVLATFGDGLEQLRQQVETDALAAGWTDDTTPLAAGGTGAKAYAEAITVYLALAIDRCADYNSSICSWNVVGEKIGHTFARQAIPMVWDYAEVNLFSSSSGNWLGAVEWIAKVVERLGFSAPGVVRQADAASARLSEQPLLISTDPPYYDNIGYADLSDFFYVWLRRHLRQIYPDLFSTLLVPKFEELVAMPTRFDGDKQAAREHFEQGLQQAFLQMRQQADPNYPLTIYYAFKQQEIESDQHGKRVASTGWETMLSGLIQSGFQITGTWPIRTELKNRTVAMGTNALSTSIVLACRPRPAEAAMATRREFLQALRRELPESLDLMVRNNLSPADLDQAMIGPGMSIFSRYTQVLAADGRPMSVREALMLINQVLAELRNEEDTEYDADTRWAIRWFEVYGFKAADYGQAEVISKAQNTSVQGLVEAGIIEAKGGQVRLLQRHEYPRNWSPDTDQRFTLWESLQHLIISFQEGGEQKAAELLFDLQHRADHVQQLAYRLFDLCEEAGLHKEAVAYNQLIQSWQRLLALRHGAQQMEAEFLKER